MIDSRASETAPLGNFNLSPSSFRSSYLGQLRIKRDRPIKSPAELLHCTNRRGNEHIHRRDDAQARPRDPRRPRLRCSKKTVPPRNQKDAGEDACNHGLVRSASIKTTTPHEGLKLGASTGPKRFPMMVKSSSERANSGEERQDLPLEKA